MILWQWQDAVHCYRQSSMVCLSVCLLVTFVSHAKTAELMEITFGWLTRVGPKEPDPTKERGQFGDFPAN